MAFSQSFLYRAIDKITPVLKKINKINEKTSKKTAKTFEKVDKASKKTTAAIKKQGNAVEKTSGKWSKLGKKISGAGKKMTGIGKNLTRKLTLPLLAGGAALLFAGGKYEKSLLSLSAITGLTGKTLDVISVKILESSEKWGIGASKFAKGMELIGSKQPALLKTPKLLLEVTKAAAMMSKAGGQEFPIAAENLLSIMNAFDITGKDAAKTVNLLAAASKFGAAQIPEISEAIKRAAAGAKIAKVGLAGVTAAVEVLAEKSGLPSTTIGIGLQNAFLKLEKTGNKKLMPSIVGLSGSLEYLSKANLSVIQLTKTFGEENIKTIVPLIANAQAVARLTKQIQGTNIAQEQSAINMGAFNEIVKKLWVTINNKLIKVFMKNRVQIKAFALGMIGAVDATASWINRNRTLTKTILIVVGVVGPLLILIGTIASTISSVLVIWGVLGPLLIANLPIILTTLSAMLPIMLAIVGAVIAWEAGFRFGKWIAGATGLTNKIKELYFWLFNVEKIKQKGQDAEMKSIRLARFGAKIRAASLIKDLQLRKSQIAMLEQERNQLVGEGVLSGKRTIEELITQRQQSTLNANININAPKGVIGSIKSKLTGDGTVTIGQTATGTL